MAEDDGDGVGDFKLNAKDVEALPKLRDLGHRDTIQSRRTRGSSRNTGFRAATVALLLMALALLAPLPAAAKNKFYGSGQVFQINPGQKMIFIPFIKNGDKCRINNVLTPCKKQLLTLPSGFEQGNLTLNGRLAYSVFYVGKSFMCAGQSNMHHPVAYDLAKAEILARADPRIHFYGFKSNRHNEVRWSDSDVSKVSSICYTFALEYLAANPDVKHVGLVKNAISSTSLDMWMPKFIKRRPPPSAKNMRSKLWQMYMKPLLKQRFESILWYQGEANAVFPKQYEDPFDYFIKALKKSWPEAKIIIFGLSTYVNAQHGNVVGMRAVQERVAAKNNAGYVHTYDLGDPFQFNVNTLRNGDISDSCPGVSDSAWYGHEDWCKRIYTPQFGKALVHPRVKSRLGYRAMLVFRGLENPRVTDISRKYQSSSGKYEYTLTTSQPCKLNKHDFASDLLHVSLDGGATFQRAATLLRRVGEKKFALTLPSPDGSVVLRHALTQRPCCTDSELVCPPEACGWLAEDTQLPLSPFELTMKAVQN